jgi:dihydrofolate reductase
MRKIIVSEFITLDGVIEAPGGNETPHPHGGWQFKYRSPEGGKYKMDELAGVDTLLLGKATYERFAAYWPGQIGEGFADPINRMPKYVVSRSLQKAEWNNSHILRDVAKDVAALKKSDGGYLRLWERQGLRPVKANTGLVRLSTNRDLIAFASPEWSHTKAMIFSASTLFNQLCSQLLGQP